MAQTMPPAKVTVNEAVRISGCSRQAVYNWVRAGIVASRKMGWQHFIDRRSLDRYLAKRRSR